MKFDVLTLFPEMFQIMRESVIGRAIDKNLIEIHPMNMRDFSKDKHKKVDDTVYGGGAGMLIRPDVVWDSYHSVKTEKSKVIYLSPQGETLTQEKVLELAKEQHLILLCGHYEGVDQRVIDEIVDEEISIGDYVLTGRRTSCDGTDCCFTLCGRCFVRRFDRGRNIFKWTFGVSTIYETRNFWRQASARDFAVRASWKY